MQSLDCSVTLLFNEDGLRLEVRDATSRVTFLRVQLDQQATCQALSRLASVPGKMQVGGLDVIGKYSHHRWMRVEMYGESWEDRKGIATKLVEAACKGTQWTPETYFDSQDSFGGSPKTGYYARTTIRTYSDSPDDVPSFPKGKGITIEER